MNLDLREIPVVYINLDRDTEKKDKIEINPKKKLRYLICNPNISLN